MEDAILKYWDRGFSSLLVLILLWRDKEVITGFKASIDGFRESIIGLKDAILKMLEDNKGRKNND